MAFFRVINKKKLLLSLLFMIASAFDGVLISGIVVYAGKFNSKSSINDVLVFGAVSLLLWFFIYAANYCFDITMSALIRDANIRIKQSYFWDKFSKSGYKSDSSAIISNLSNDLKLIETNYFQPIFAIMSSSLLFVVSLIYMLYMNALVSAFFILFSILPIIVPKLLGAKLSAAGDKWSKANENYVKNIKEVFQGIGVLKTYQVFKRTYSRSLGNLKKLESSNYELNKAQSFAGFWGAVLSGVSFIVPFVIGCYFIIFTHTLSFNVLIGIFLANDRVVSPLSSIAEQMSKISSTKNMVKKYLSYNNLSFKNNIIPYDAPKKIASSQNKELYKLKLSNVNFKIDSTHQLALSLSLSGKFKALITGVSGSGKTTLLNIIRGAVQPDSGSIKAWDTKGNEINLNENVAYIDQEPYIFDASILDNVCLFESEAFPIDTVKRVLKRVKLFDELGGEKSLDFRCGDNGDRLSGGQRQRVEIARALIRHRAIYLVDEATASLDDENAKQIRRILFNLNKPIIEVAHHYTDTRNYTDIFKIDNGVLEKV